MKNNFEMIRVKVDIKKFTRILAIVFTSLLLLNVLFILLRYQFMPTTGGIQLLDQYFNFATEVNLPTFFNTVLLFMAAQSFYVLATYNVVEEVYFKVYLYCLASIFVFLSVDEFASIHEWFSYGVPKLTGVGGSGLLRFAWIIPYGIFVVGFGFFSIKFLRALKKTYLYRYVGAGVLYLMGVIVMEALGGKFVEMNNGIETMNYYLFFTTPEESFEMISMIWLLHTNIKALSNDEALIS